MSEERVNGAPEWEGSYEWINGIIEWEGPYGAIDHINGYEIDDVELGALWDKAQTLYLDFDAAMGDVIDYLDKYLNPVKDE